MNYLRPQENILEKKGTTLTISDEEIIVDSKTGLSIPHQVSYIEHFETDGLPLPLTIEFTPDLKKITPELRQKQKDFIELKHNCVRVAEALNDNLRAFLIRYSQYKKSNETIEINQMDFMKLRDKLSEIIKKDSIFRSIGELENSTKRKIFTKTFTFFIEDRNIYTHGILHVRLLDNFVIITYLDKKYNFKASCVIDKEIVQSYFNTYVWLSQILEEMGKLLINRN
ncbi:MAG TPA: hypothetical protein VK718_06715 [Ferruginibacter sp.]|jgi:hypothetical protein|nr:hypothetical protein [Ferruginibacter sp.]